MKRVPTFQMPHPDEDESIAGYVVYEGTTILFGRDVKSADHYPIPTGASCPWTPEHAA